ncbi:MAG TPA: ATP-dependent DNA helicase RecG [Frankiaceae bacterium]|nr:ATP-dependent DNA helicase RecG [Frankiaceae bacterium]
MVGLDTKLREVVGGRAATVLADAFSLVTVGDLLGHLPRRYHERGELTDLACLRPGEHVTVQAQVAKVIRRPMRNRRTYLDVGVTDGRHSLSLTFFNQPWRERDLRVGTTAFFAGKVEEFRGRRQLVNPEVALLDGEGGDGFAGSLVPIYPATARLATWTIARCVRLALEAVGELDDPLPAPLRARHRLPGLREAYELVHRPESYAEVRRGRNRLKWDEALVLQVRLAQRRAATERIATTPRPARPDGLLAAFDASLPFALTAGQRAVGEALAAELARPFPMHRLLQGEVGSGKTVVALRAMLTVVDAGGQAALLAPTEVLAVQHARNLGDLLGPLGRAGELSAADRATRIALLTGSLGAPARRAALAEVADGSAGLVVGTHALLEEQVRFRDLGLVVVDEQHRFGVEQRDALRTRAERPPHVLVMTATPIPRTVAMTVFGDLETSALGELPAGRSPIRSFVVPGDNPGWTERMWGRVRDEVAAGHQAYVVCPRIGGDPEPEEEPVGPPADTRRPAAAVLDALPALREHELAGLRVEALHGRLPPEAKDAVMTGFARGEVDVLVATTVVEVGVDVPNATAMVVLDADRFGVSQLHQLRGRVGRGGGPGWCLLHTDAPPDTPARERLDTVAATLDGAVLARLDLRQRREGDVLGVAQSGGRRTLKLLELLEDEDLLAAARAEASALVAADPGLARDPVLARAVAAALDEESAAYLEKG